MKDGIPKQAGNYSKKPQLFKLAAVGYIEDGL
jgi:hypothetical protein